MPSNAIYPLPTPRSGIFSEMSRLRNPSQVPRFRAVCSDFQSDAIPTIQSKHHPVFSEIRILGIDIPPCSRKAVRRLHRTAAISHGWGLFGEYVRFGVSINAQPIYELGADFWREQVRRGRTYRAGSISDNHSIVVWGGPAAMSNFPKCYIASAPPIRPTRITRYLIGSAGEKFLRNPTT